MYGQFSYEHRRRMTIEEFKLRNRLYNEVSKPKTCTGHNRFVVSQLSGAKQFWLLDTPVVTLSLDGSITLRDDGWQTMTTRRAMMEGIFELTGKAVGIYGDSRANTDHIMGSTPFRCPFTFKPRRS